MCSRQKGQFMRDRIHVCSVVDLQHGWDVRFKEEESQRFGWEIAGLLVKGPEALLGLNASPKGRGCLRSLEGPARRGAATETQTGAGRVPLEGCAQFLVSSHTCPPVTWQSYL